MQVVSPGWRIRSTTRGARTADGGLPGLPPEFLTDDSRVAEEVIVEPAPAARGQAAGAPALDLTADVEPGRAAILAIRHPSNALTFHLPIQSRTRGPGGSSQARFRVTIRSRATRGIASQAIKAILVKVAELGGDRIVSFALPKLVAAYERQTWKKRGLAEGWLGVTKETLAAGALSRGTPLSPERSLLLIHGTFANAVSAYRALAATDFFERVKDIYGDRLFAFNHFSLSRTPDENVRMLLQGLPEQTTNFDVITHSRGGLVLRTLVERADQFGPAARRFRLGTAVLVASPNGGTPLATPDRWDHTVGWLANILELFPDNPFTTGAEFVANGLVWLANHASGDIAGLHAMDGEGGPIKALEGPPGPPADAYSALVANYSPGDDVLRRLLDVGLDQFFGSANDLVVPSEGGWRIDRSSTRFIPGPRIGCFGPGGNLAGDAVTHLNFFSRPETVDFLVAALHGRKQSLTSIDPRKPLPDRRLLRGELPVTEEAERTTVTVSAAPRRRERPAEPAVERLRVSVTNGDLSFERHALLLGHYASTTLTGTEQVMNRLIGGAMDRSLRKGVYPLLAGSHEIFVNSHVDRDGERGVLIPRPAAVIVVGLGPEGKLKAGDLVRAVRLAVIGWARRLSEPGANRPDGMNFELASTLIGSGGTGVSADHAARLIAQGVWEANDSLDDDETDGRWPRCSHLRLIELYLDRATEAWNALRLQQAVTPDRFSLEPVVRAGSGALQRPPDSGYRGANYDFITVDTRNGSDGEPTIEYTLDTRRARSEIRGQRTQSRLISQLVATASNDRNQEHRIGRTLFDLLIPVELEAFLADSGELQMALGTDTAAIPWELLEVNRSSFEELPWAIRVKLLRKLRIGEFRQQVVDADAEASALVIGEPACPPGYPRLEGARAEAQAVHASLTGPARLARDKVVLLSETDPSATGPDAERVINTLFDRSWRIVHIAGHGVPGVNGKAGGVVLSNDTFLGPAEIRSMRVVPELVFINCCYLARGDDSQLLHGSYDRVTFASGVAGALIEIGVRCVIAAGWAVDDAAATEFASAFYGSLLRGNRFIDAVADARLAAYTSDPRGNTWAAYQCYGDADWRFRPGLPDADEARPGADEFSTLASATALRLVLERIAVETKFQGVDPPAQVSRLQELETMLGKPERSAWANGAIAEYFGHAYAEAGAMESAMRWYERAMHAPDARGSLKAAEQLANARSRFGWELVDKALRHRDAMAHQQAHAATPAARGAARRARADAERKLDEAVATAQSFINEGLKLLEELVRFKSTMERESLVGSAFKRRALVNLAAGRAAEARRDIAAMKRAYTKAVRVGGLEGGAEVYYPLSNCLAADAALLRGDSRAPLDERTVKRVTEYLEAKSAVEADFWSVVGTIELEEYQAISARKLAAREKHLQRRYKDLYARARSRSMWASVYDNGLLVLGIYARRATSAKEQAAAEALVTTLRAFAHQADAR